MENLLTHWGDCMRFCPFCESPSAKWPEYASEYVRGYPLCEHHMGLALSTAQVKVYDNARVLRSRKLKKIYSAVEKAVKAELVSQAKEIHPDKDLTEAIIHGSLGLIDGIDSELLEVESLFDDVDSPNFDLGDPIRVYIDESELDRWMTLRLKTLAKKVDGNIYRCVAKYESKPDNRCINFASTHGGKCKSCQSKETDIADVSNAHKLDRIMRIIRDE